MEFNDFKKMMADADENAPYMFTSRGRFFLRRRDGRIMQISLGEWRRRQAADNSLARAVSIFGNE